MTLTAIQQRKVEENMGLVHQVIKDKVHGYNQWGFYTYDDLFQIGCVGLCKAAATDKGGTFSTYAYRLIWHEICDALIQSTKRYSDEITADVTPYKKVETENGEFLSGLPDAQFCQKRGAALNCQRDRRNGYDVPGIHQQ